MSRFLIQPRRLNSVFGQIGFTLEAGSRLESADWSPARSDRRGHRAVKVSFVDWPSESDEAVAKVPSKSRSASKATHSYRHDDPAQHVPHAPGESTQGSRSRIFPRANGSVGRSPRARVRSAGGRANRRIPGWRPRLRPSRGNDPANSRATRHLARSRRLDSTARFLVSHQRLPLKTQVGRARSHRAIRGRR